jgi:hypothetical protein
MTTKRQEILEKTHNSQTYQKYFSSDEEFNTICPSKEYVDKLLENVLEGLLNGQKEV